MRRLAFAALLLASAAEAREAPGRAIADVVAVPGPLYRGR
ncbi:hypothetical protein FHS79_001141 [Polymorphobacter multimanifer]|uniref:Uncharacterized protein n=1 Tax=Polymorphobacter multimanifer TaxID=1070431 RepID=A0A841L2D9_9SPHN|nr:hypothetical protein [Polymorphobacter multimanifer]